MSTFQIIPDQDDDSSMIILKTDNEHHLYKVDNSVLMQATNSSDDIALDDDNKIILSLASPEEISNGENVCSDDATAAAIQAITCEGFPFIVQNESELILPLSNGKLTNKPKTNKFPSAFKCSIPGCGKLLVGLDNLRAHAISHSDQQTFKCIIDSCEWSFKSMYKLTRHLESHVGLKEYICDVNGCNRRFTTIYNLKNHKKAHDRPLIISCLYCDEKFAAKHLMEVHLKSHKNIELPYECSRDDCNKRFRSNHALSVHLRTHRKNFAGIICSHEGCGKEFNTLCRLKAHLRKHTGERPFACSFQGCTWTFTTASKLSRHVRKHTGERNHICPFENCMKAFMRAQHLKEHINSHSKTKNFSCTHEGCPAKFFAKSSLYMHMKKHRTPRMIKTHVFICPFADCNVQYSDCNAKYAKSELEMHLSQHISSCSKPVNASEIPVSETSDNVIKKSSDLVKQNGNHREKTIKISKSNNVDQFGYFSLLSNDEVQEMSSLEAPSPNTTTTSAEYQAAVNSITESADTSTPEIYSISISIPAGQSSAETSPEKSVAHGTSPAVESNAQIMPAASSPRTSSLNLDVNSIALPSDLESPLVSRIIRQENYSGSARTDYCCSRSNLRETSPLKLREVDDSETNNEGVTSPHKKKNNPLDKQGTTATVSSIPNLTLAPTDVVLTSGAITFRDPTTGAHFVQTQLLQDDPPEDCRLHSVIANVYSHQASTSSGSISNVSQFSVPSTDITAVPVSLLTNDKDGGASQEHDNTEFSNLVISLRDFA